MVAVNNRVQVLENMFEHVSYDEKTTLLEVYKNEIQKENELKQFTEELEKPSLHPLLPLVINVLSKVRQKKNK